MTTRRLGEIHPLWQQAGIPSGAWAPWGEVNIVWARGCRHQLAAQDADEGAMMAATRAALASVAARGLSATRRPVRPISHLLDRLELRFHTWEVRFDPTVAKWCRDTRAAMDAGTLEFTSTEDLRQLVERERRRVDGSPRTG